MRSPSLATTAAFFAIAGIACACSSKSDPAPVGPAAPDAEADDANAPDAFLDGDAGSADAADAAIACAPRYVLSSDTTQLTLLGEATPLWVPASADETIVAYASDTTSAVVIDELPGNPARFAIVNVPFDHTKARRVVVENDASRSPQIVDRTAYWTLGASSAPALRSVALDAPGAQTAHTVTTFAADAIPSQWFIDGDAVYWIDDRPDPNVPSNPRQAVLTYAALAGDGTHLDGATLGPVPAAAPGNGGEPYAFAAADVKAGYVYFVLIAQLGDPPVTSAFAVKREPVLGGTIETLATMQTGFAQLFVREQFVYWVADLSTHLPNGDVGAYDYAIYQSSLDGSGTRKIAVHDTWNDLTSIPRVHVEGSVLYWFDGPSPTPAYLRAFCEL